MRACNKLEDYCVHFLEYQDDMRTQDKFKNQYMRAPDKFKDPYLYFERESGSGSG